MTSGQKNQNPDNNSNLKELTEKLFNERDDNTNNGFYICIEEIKDNSNAPTETENNNSLKKNNVNSKKITLGSNKGENESTLKKVNKKEHDDGESNDTINKITYSNGESNKQRKKNNVVPQQNETEDPKTTQANTTKEETKSIEDINKIKIKNVLYESEFKTINEVCSQNFLDSLVEFTENRIGEKLNKSLIKIKLNDIHIYNKKIIDIFEGSIREEIESQLKKENENNEQRNQKKLNLLFNEIFKERYIKFLNDDKFILNEGLKMELEGFKTFSNYYENIEQKEDIKKCVYLFLKIDYPQNKSENKITETQQTTNNHYDSRKLITNQIVKSFHNVLNNIAYNYGNKLYKPILKHIFKYNVEDYEFSFKKSTNYIYSILKPKKQKEGINYNEKINEIITLEKKEEEEEQEEQEKEPKNIKINLLLENATIFDIAKAFINDEKFIKITIEGKEFKLFLINFKTYKDYFKHLEKELYIDLRKDYIDLLEGRIPSRKSNLEKNNENENENENEIEFLKKKRYFK